MRRHLTARIEMLALAVLLVGCSTGMDEARQGVDEFRARASRQAFAEIYWQAAPELRQTTNEAQFVKLMSALERKLGPWQSAGDPGWNVTRGTGGHLVRLSFESRFARGPAVESFAWRIERGRAVLLGYHVNSALLVTE
jgi:hypothetical protein